MVRSFLAFVLSLCFVTHLVAANPHGNIVPDDKNLDRKKAEAVLLSNTRQLTFEGRRAGEGYFSADGSLMAFQSERDSSNPFFQIYLMDLEFGDVQRISPGHGKTTCSWVHPSGEKVLYASTHLDPEAKAKQAAELKAREEGKERRYSWDYDHHFDLFETHAETGKTTRLTTEKGYDAEGSWSPDGKLIAFASNRHAYTSKLSEEEQKTFGFDKSYFMEIYVMNADGTNVRRLTNTDGYDGGPFFSADGKRICWRRFSKDGARAEIFTMNIDGSDQRQLTRLQAMSWAPYFHPSGEYLIFATNRHGFSNFELYLVDAAGKRDPVRVTYTLGFDGLPTFTPDGKKLSWTSNRTPKKKSQIFLADWNHDKARELLGLTKSATVAPEALTRMRKQGSTLQTQPAILPEDARRHVGLLCSMELAGRMTGDAGNRLATEYVASVFKSYGLQPAGDDGSFFQSFDFTAGVDLGPKNKLVSVIDGKSTTYELDTVWRPLAYSKLGPIDKANVVWAGYGIKAPKSDDQAEYDSFVHLDVKDKWVLAFRYLPEELDKERKQHIARYASLRYKAMVARDAGARGLIVVSGPNSGVKDQLVRLAFDTAIAGTSIPAITITDDLASQWLATAGKDLKKLQDKLDAGEMMMGFALDKVSLEGGIDIKRIRKTGRNVIARLNAADKPGDSAIIIGAHIDHLGMGGTSSSLARGDERSKIHCGADDNASGVSAMLEVAEYLADLKKRGKLKAMKRDVLFGAWSGEELGLLGSAYFTRTYGKSTHGGPSAAHHGGHSKHPHAAAPKNPHATPKNPHATPKHPHGSSKNPHAASGKHPHASAKNPHAAAGKHSHGSHAHKPDSLSPAIAACLNMDMVGRLDKKFILYGVGSSSVWRSEIEKRNAPIGLPVVALEDSFIPTDATSFYVRGVPILSAFTGSHPDYHTPRDTPDKLNYDGIRDIAKFMSLVARSLVLRSDVPDYISQKRPEKKTSRGMRAFLGTIPDYSQTDIKGLKLSGASKGGPADKAGIKNGDVVVELAGKKVENIYDYTYAIQDLRIGKPVKIVVVRDGKRVTLEVTPGSRD